MGFFRGIAAALAGYCAVGTVFSRAEQKPEAATWAIAVGIALLAYAALVYVDYEPEEPTE